MQSQEKHPLDTNPGDYINPTGQGSGPTTLSQGLLQGFCQFLACFSFDIFWLQSSISAEDHVACTRGPIITNGSVYSEHGPWLLFVELYHITKLRL